jgi:FMN phosphatase YigB (HAD superfamily)
MITFKERKTVYFDCDDTLLEWKTCSEDEEGALRIENNGHAFYKKVISANVEALIDHSLAGHLVVVWSAGGSTWAETIIKALNIELYVDVILNKPDFYYDDKDPSHWMPERQFKA